MFLVNGWIPVIDTCTITFLSIYGQGNTNSAFIF